MPANRTPWTITSIGRPDPARASAVLPLLGLAPDTKARYLARPVPLKRGGRAARPDEGAGARHPD
jgi:hypothetical protein